MGQLWECSMVAWNAKTWATQRSLNPGWSVSQKWSGVHFAYLRDLLQSFRELASSSFQMRSCMMPMSYTPSAQQRARAVMWTQWRWGSCLRCWRSSVDINYSYSAGMKSLDKVCFPGGIRQQMTKIRGHTCDPSTGEAEPGWMGIQGQYVETLFQTRTKKETSFLSFPFPFLPLPTSLSCYKCLLNTWGFQKSIYRAS